MKKLLFIVLISVIMITCSDPDPCAGIVCNNGGTCDNGTCECTEFYGGPSCSVPRVPTAILVSKIDILKWPTTTSAGGGWDLNGTGPDIFIAVVKNPGTANESTIHTSASASNNTGGGFLSYTPTLNISLSADGSTYSIRLYDDDDELGNEFMAGIIFTPSQEITGFPSTITLDAGGTVAYKLYVTYDFL